MTKPKLIGITANQRLNPAIDNVSWTYVPTDLVKAIKQAGGTPLLLPIGDEETVKNYLDLVDKVIIIGGQHVDPRFYGEEKLAKEHDYFLERDIYEMTLIKECLKRNKPLFTICRGMQLTNVTLGGSLYQDIDQHCQTEEPNIATQTISIEPSSTLSKIYGNEATINSLHRQSIKDLAEELKVIAKDPRDGTIEAIVFADPKKRYLGVQWHPEFLWKNSSTEQAFFDYIVNHL